MPRQKGKASKSIRWRAALCLQSGQHSIAGSAIVVCLIGDSLQDNPNPWRKNNVPYIRLGNETQFLLFSISEQIPPKIAETHESSRRPSPAKEGP
jgi:hypothetical protein